MFNAADFSFFVGYFVLTTLIGFVAARREKRTVSDYFLAATACPGTRWAPR